MGSRWMLPVTCALFTLLTPACGGDGTPTEGASQTPGDATPTPTASGTSSPGDTPTGATPTPGEGTTPEGTPGTPTQPPVSAVVGVQTLLLDQTSLTAIPGAQVCLNKTGGACGTSDSDGKVTVTGVPANAENTLRIAPQEKYGPWLLTVTTGEEALSLGSVDPKAPGIQLTSDQLLSDIAAARGVTPDEKLGILKIKVIGVAGAFDGVKGIQVNLSPANQGTGPIYMSDSGAPDAAQTSTSNRGTVYWVNVPAGTYAFSIKSSTLSCTHAGFAWDGSSAGVFEMTAVEGATTYSTVICQ